MSSTFPRDVAKKHDLKLWREVSYAYGDTVATALLYELATDEDVERRNAAEAVIRGTIEGPCAQTFLRRAVAMLGRSARSRVRKKLGPDYFPEYGPR